MSAAFFVAKGEKRGEARGVRGQQPVAVLGVRSGPVVGFVAALVKSADRFVHHLR